MKRLAQNLLGGACVAFVFYLPLIAYLLRTP